MATVDEQDLAGEVRALRTELDDLRREVGVARTLEPKALRWFTRIDQRAREDNDGAADLEAHVYHSNADTIIGEIYDRPAGVWRDAFSTMPVDIPANFLYDHLHDSVADSDDMNVNGSVTAVNFDFEVATGKIFILSRINAQFRDNTKDIPNGFFSLAALGNGLLIQILDTDGTTVLQDFDTTADPLKNHADMIALAGVDVDTDSTANVSAGGFRFSIFKTGSFMKLTAGQKVRVVVQDNLEAMQEFRFMVQGTLKDA